MGVLANVRVLTAPRHAAQEVVDEIEGGGAVDVPLQRGQHQQLEVLWSKKRATRNIQNSVSNTLLFREFFFVRKTCS